MCREIDVHLLVPAPGSGTGILVRQIDRTLACVRTELADDDTLVVALHRHLQDRWALDATILETYLPFAGRSRSMMALAALDAPSPDWRPPDGLAWGAAPQALPGPVAARARTWLGEWSGAALPPSDRPRWSRPGWHERAAAWIDGALMSAGQRRTGPIEVRRLWSLSALMRISTDSGDAWFKAVFPQFHHEPAVTDLLAGVAPQAVPTVLARNDEAGWLLLDDVPGAALDVSTDAAAITGAVRALVDVQRRVLDRHGELRALGVPHRPMRELATGLREAIATAAVMDELLADPARASSIVGWVDDRASWLDGIGLPEMIVHGDFNRSNVLTPPGGSVIIDWSDAAIAHPLLDVAVWLVHPQGRFGPDDPSWPAWLDALAPFADTAPLRDELETVFGLGAAYQVVSYADILLGVEPALRYQVNDGLRDFWNLLDAAVPR
ncbi:MAG: aminoglycoside phosphotransferase family protein [Chloroflexi bacterium]|nr:aminoglycoside phosphotransferase family protein [Chloroflexota bacterium]